MKRQMVITGLAALLAATGIQAARAAPGIVVQNVNLRAGPDTGYPLIEPLDAGTPVQIFGCLDGWTWCDVATADARGWAAGPTLQVVYDNQPVYLAQYGAAVGLGFIGFEVGDYWGRYYRNRPFYGERDRFRGGPGFDRPGVDRPGFGRPGDGRPGDGRPGFDRPGFGGPGPGFRGGPGGGPGGEPGRGPGGPPGGLRGEPARAEAARPGNPGVAQRGPGPVRGGPPPGRGAPPAARPAPRPEGRPDQHG